MLLMYFSSGHCLIWPVQLGSVSSVRITLPLRPWGKTETGSEQFRVQIKPRTSQLIKTESMKPLDEWTPGS